MPKYIVLDGHKKFGGRMYEPGDEIECDEATAKTMRLAPRKAEKTPDPAPADKTAKEPVKADETGKEQVKEAKKGKK